MQPIQNLATEVMSRTGLSRLALATFLQIDNSLLTRYEAGTRTLPAAAMLKLTILYKELPHHKDATLATAVSSSSEEQDEMRQHAQYCQAKAVQLGKQLAKMRQANEQANLLLQLLATLGKDAAGQTPRQVRWLEEQSYQASKRLQKNSWLTQKKIRDIY